MICTVVLICGPPASGKTELTNALLAELPRAISISFDDFCGVDQQEFAVKVKHGFKDLRQRFLTAAKDILDHKTDTDAARTILKGRTDLSWDLIVVEDNFYRHSMRYKWFQEVRRRGMSFCTVCFTTPLEICLQRNRTRHFPVPEVVILQQFSKLELPDGNKNPWEKFSLVSPFPSVKDVQSLVMLARSSPFTLQEVERNCEEYARSREQTKFSESHQMDLAYRRAVAELIRQAPQTSKRSLYAQLSRWKSDIIGSELITGCPQTEAYERIVNLLRYKIITKCRT